MEKVGLIIGLILTIIGIYKIDRFLIPTLDYFGKYVFFIAFNIFVFWVLWGFYKKFSGIMRVIMPIIFGIIILLIGIKFF
jgi:hypothetical protein